LDGAKRLAAHGRAMWLPNLYLAVALRPDRQPSADAAGYAGLSRPRVGTKRGPRTWAAGARPAPERPGWVPAGPTVGRRHAPLCAGPSRRPRHAPRRSPRPFLSGPRSVREQRTAVGPIDAGTAGPSPLEKPRNSATSAL